MRSCAGELVADGDAATGKDQTGDGRKEKEDFDFHAGSLSQDAAGSKIKSPAPGLAAAFRISPAVFDFPPSFSTALLS